MKLQQLFIVCGLLVLAFGCHEPISHTPGVVETYEEGVDWQKQIDLIGVADIQPVEGFLFIGGNFSAVGPNGTVYEYAAFLDSDYQFVESDFNNYKFTGEGISGSTYENPFGKSDLWLYGTFNAMDEPTGLNNGKNLMYLDARYFSPTFSYPANTFGIGNENSKVKAVTITQNRIYLGGDFLTTQQNIASPYLATISGATSTNTDPISGWDAGEVQFIKYWQSLYIGAKSLSGSNYILYNGFPGLGSHTPVSIGDRRFTQLYDIDFFEIFEDFPHIISGEFEGENYRLILGTNPNEYLPITQLSSPSGKPVKLKSVRNERGMLIYGDGLKIEGSAWQSNVVMLSYSRNRSTGNMEIQLLPIGNIQEPVLDLNWSINNDIHIATTSGIYSYPIGINDLSVISGL